MAALNKELIALEPSWLLNISLWKQNEKRLLTLWKLWFFKKCCPHRSQVSTYSHGQDQVLCRQLCPSRLCLWTLPTLHKAKDSPAVPRSPSPHLTRPAAVAALTSALRSHRGTSPNARATAINALLWQAATSLSPAAPKPVLPSQGFRSGCELSWQGLLWLMKRSWVTGEKHMGKNWYPRWKWDERFGKLKHRLASWHPSWGRKRMNKCSSRKQGAANSEW